MKTATAVMALLSAVGLGALGASLAGVKPTVTGTRVVVYSPTTASGALTSTLQVTEHLQGHCSGGGVAGGSSYRCLTRASRIIDPCFAALPRGPFYCPSNPMLPEVVEITVQSPAAVTTIEPAERSWAVELEDRQVCIAVNAAIGTRGPLQCLSTTPGHLEDCRVAVRASPYWTAACQARGAQTSPLRAYKVLEAWT